MDEKTPNQPENELTIRMKDTVPAFSDVWDPEKNPDIHPWLRMPEEEYWQQSEASPAVLRFAAMTLGMTYSWLECDRTTMVPFASGLDEPKKSE